MSVVGYFWRWAGFWAGFISGFLAHRMYYSLDPPWLRTVLAAGIILMFIISGIPLTRARRKAKSGRIGML